MVNLPEIFSYPYCLQNGVLVGADDIQEFNGNLTCLGCGSTTVTLNSFGRPTFEHSRDKGQNCNVQTAIQNASKIAIQDGFNAAKAVGRKYLLVCVCEGCLKYLNYDLTESADKAVLDFSSHGITRNPDVMFLDQDDLAVLAVQLVFDFALESEPYEEYRNFETPVFEVQPTWDAIEQFRSMHISGSHHRSNVVSVKIAQVTCLSCQQGKQK